MADYESQKSNIDGLLQGDKFKLDEKEISAPSIISEATAFLPKTCPPPEQISMSSNGGHTFRLSYEPVCGLAADLSWLIVAAASVAAALYIGRSVGGA
ncbi:MAG TPA: hypothetical protein DD403_12575 [Pseudomonas sp.]|nr:hypothetical protein [Pseudomonas sp.]